MIYFPRHQLAADMADAVRGHTLFSDAPNGLFLAAPRRTGKTTFLRNDLLPTLETQGVEVVYVDLWSDQQRDPAQLIQAAIQEAMAPAPSRHREAGSTLGHQQGRARTMDPARCHPHRQRGRLPP